MEREGRRGGNGKWVAIVLVTAGVLSAVVGYMVRPINSRPSATQPVEVQTGADAGAGTAPAAR
jgi:hypothetical protein